MSGLNFWKTETIGNDFVLLHEADVVERDLTDNLPELAVKLCDRKFGIGSDGLLLTGVQDGVLRQRMFNPDGTEDFCGNGLRCSALHAYRLGWVGANHMIEHFGRIVDARVTDDGLATVSIGPGGLRARDRSAEHSHPSGRTRRRRGLRLCRLSSQCGHHALRDTGRRATRRRDFQRSRSTDRAPRAVPGSDEHRVRQADRRKRAGRSVSGSGASARRLAAAPAAARLPLFGCASTTCVAT